MPKLLTPQQYENSLDELNELRPLQLADEIQHKIDIAVCDKLPVTTKKAVTGMLTKGTHQGALLAKLNKNYIAYEVKSLTLFYIIPTGSISFARKVSFVLCVYVSGYGVTGLLWTEPSFAKLLKVLSPTGNTFIEFCGYQVFFKANGTGNWGGNYDFYGFY